MVIGAWSRGNFVVLSVVQYSELRDRELWVFACVSAFLRRMDQMPSIPLDGAVFPFSLQFLSRLRSRRL